jgi:3-deoxy-D-manno-octulosonic-acid transferase/heptosyltransferase-1
MLPNGLLKGVNNLEMNKPDSILIVKLSAIGDVVHTLPLLEVLRKNFPQARIDWVVEEEAGQIIMGHSMIDHVLVSHRKTWQKSLTKRRHRTATLREMFRFIRELRSHKYDLVIDLHGLFKSGVLTGLSRAKRKIGFTGGREGSSLFLTERPYYVNYDQHALDRYLKTIDYMGCTMYSWKGDIPVDGSDRDAIESFILNNDLQNKKIVAINPIARWKTKLWEPERFSLLADRVQKELNVKVVFTGSEQDRGVIDEIVREMETIPLDLAGRTSLKALAYLYSKCDLLITTDTGPMHMAAAMGCPVIALFGPTAPWRTGPYGKEHRVIREEMECSPCFKKKCDHLSCMKDITVDGVFDTVKEYFDGAHKR